MTLRQWQVMLVSELPDPGAREFYVGEGDWPFRGVLVRYEGSLHAYANICPHLGHPLNLFPDRFFTPDNERLLCASHGAQFDPASGACVAGPCSGKALRRLPCSEVDGHIVVTAPASMRDAD